MIELKNNILTIDLPEINFLSEIDIHDSININEIHEICNYISICYFEDTDIETLKIKKKEYTEKVIKEIIDILDIQGLIQK